MAAETAGVGVTKPADVGFKRELGLIGATWASETSIIGSGWLFGALFAAQAVGGAAVIAWVIAGIIIIILALCHAELGAMFPVSGGTARFPHFAFGSVAGIGFGFFAYMQAVTIAPIECFAFMQYASYYWPGLYDSTTKNVTGAGFILTIVLMAVFVAVNFLAMRIFARVNNVITWWKVAVPVLAIIVLLTHWHTGNFTAGGTGFMPGGIKALFGALPAAGIIFAYSGFEQCDQLAGEIKNPGRNLPRAIVISVLIGTAIYCLLQVAFIVALPPALLGGHGGLIGLSCPSTGTCNPSISELNAGPFAAVAVLAGVGWLAHILRIDAFISPSGTGLIYTTGTSRISYGLARNRYAPQIFARVDRNGVPWVGLIGAFLIGLLFLLPFPSWHSLVGLITGASVLMYAGAPLSLGAFRRQIPEADRPYRMQAAWLLAPARVRRRRPAHLLVGLRGDLEARHRPGHRVRADRHLDGVRPAAAAAGLEVGGVAAGVADRHGHHLLAGPVQRGRATSTRCRRPTPSTSGSGGTSWSWPRSAWPSTSGRCTPGCRVTRCSCWSTGRPARTNSRQAPHH